MDYKVCEYSTSQFHCELSIHLSKKLQQFVNLGLHPCITYHVGDPNWQIVVFFYRLIMIRKCLFFSLCLCSLIYAKDLKYFSNFKPGPLQVGRESVVTDFVTLTNDPGSDLPNGFTVCTSLFMDILTTQQSIVQIMKKDGTAWIFLYYDVKSSSSTREDLYYCIQAGK